MTPRFKKYAHQVIKNAEALARDLSSYGFSLVSGGTDTHLILIDLHNKNITGHKAQNMLEKAQIVVNKNTVPYDKRSPFDPSGIRLGVAALTTRGMKEKEMAIIAGFINEVVSNPKFFSKTRKEVQWLAEKFPIL